MKGLGGAVIRMGAGLQLETMKSSGEGCWRWLHNSVKALNTIELYTYNVQMLNFMLYMFYHNKKLVHFSVSTLYLNQKVKVK